MVRHTYIFILLILPNVDITYNQSLCDVLTKYGKNALQTKYQADQSHITQDFLRPMQDFQKVKNFQNVWITLEINIYPLGLVMFMLANLFTIRKILRMAFSPFATFSRSGLPGLSLSCWQLRNTFLVNTTLFSNNVTYKPLSVRQVKCEPFFINPDVTLLGS